jgi:hypothetical protein
VQEDLTEFLQRGVQVVAIGQGTGREAERFGRQWGIEFPCLGDPEGASYRAYQMTRGTVWTVALRDIVREPIASMRLMARADLRGARLAASDVLLLGGVAIVGKGGVLRFIHHATKPADIPPNHEVLSALDAM